MVLKFIIIIIIIIYRIAPAAVVVLASFSPAQLQSRSYTNRVCAGGLHFSAFH